MSDPHNLNKDELLDRMLAVYGEVHPPDGLERRVLETVERTLNRRRRLWWLLAAPVAVSFAVFAFLFGGRTTNPGRTSMPELPRTLPIVVRPEPVSTPPRSARVVTKGQRRALPVKATSIAHPLRQATFPGPSELSEQERVLLSLMESNEEALIALAQLYSAGRTNADRFGLKERIP